MTMNTPKAERRAAVMQHCTPMEMTRAGRQRSFAASSPRGGSGIPIEEEAEGPPSAAGETIGAGDLWLGLA
jgi:hypothetical protein